MRISWCLQFEGVVERALSGVGVRAAEPMALGEALRVDVSRVDIGLKATVCRIMGSL
jgi:hypothetical protein